LGGNVIVWKGRIIKALDLSGSTTAELTALKYPPWKWMRNYKKKIFASGAVFTCLEQRIRRSKDSHGPLEKVVLITGHAKAVGGWPGLQLGQFLL
jgi:hypothetical protein